VPARLSSFRSIDSTIVYEGNQPTGRRHCRFASQLLIRSVIPEIIRQQVELVSVSENALSCVKVGFMIPLFCKPGKCTGISLQCIRVGSSIHLAAVASKDKAVQSHLLRKK
jgi:hypothetical protein